MSSDTDDKKPPEDSLEKRGGEDIRVKQQKRRITDSDWNRGINRVRDVAFLTFGLAGVVGQLFFADPPNPVLYPIIAGLL